MTFRSEINVNVGRRKLSKINSVNEQKLKYKNDLKSKWELKVLRLILTRIIYIQ